MQKIEKWDFYHIGVFSHFLSTFILFFPHIEVFFAGKKIKTKPPNPPLLTLVFDFETA